MQRCVAIEYRIKSVTPKSAQLTHTHAHNALASRDIRWDFRQFQCWRMRDTHRINLLYLSLHLRVSLSLRFGLSFVALFRSIYVCARARASCTRKRDAVVEQRFKDSPNKASNYMQNLPFTRSDLLLRQSLAVWMMQSEKCMRTT